MRTAFIVFVALSLASTACKRGASTSEPDEDRAASESGADAGGEADEGGEADGALAVGESSGKQLPSELLAELRLVGDGADGRLLTLAPGFIATAACSDCGAPTYLWFLAVRCRDNPPDPSPASRDPHGMVCEVLTESCEGSIAREGERFELAFKPVEGVAAETCAGYSGSFERP